MDYGEIRGTGYANSVKTMTLGDIAEEVLRARDKFPGTDLLTVALGEEFGELCKARSRDGGGDGASLRLMRTPPGRGLGRRGLRGVRAGEQHHVHGASGATITDTSTRGDEHDDAGTAAEPSP